jgi:hypothetical protein
MAQGQDTQPSGPDAPDAVGAGRGAERQGQLVALAAWSIRSATTCGWLSIAQWDEVGTSTTLRAFARLYIQRSAAGGMALSWPATSPHTGIVCHAAAVVG